MSEGYLSLTDADREEMLAAIGVSSVDELFEQVPVGVRLDRELDVPPALGEAELVRHLSELAERNAHTGVELSFLGAGIYDHYVPALVDVLLSRGEFLTAYTPYQPEMSQGVLQAIFEYQTVICELTGMDVSNASGYDGTTVAADACFVAKHTSDRTKIVLAETLNPQVREVVKTYAPGFDLEIVEVPHRGGTIDPDELAAAAADAAAVFFQQPNFFGCLEPPSSRPLQPMPGLTRSPTSISSRSACSKLPASTAARWRSVKARAWAVRRSTAAPTTDSSQPGRTSYDGCPVGS